MSAAYQPGTLIHARGRDWIVQPQSADRLLVLRPLTGTGEWLTHLHLDLEPEPPRPASFPPPDPKRTGNQADGLILRDALLLQLRAGAGPLRGFGQISVDPRPYQLAPLLMALKHPVVRLLIADDVGLGKTIEAGLILRELVDRGEAGGFTVLCPPHLCDQWQKELLQRFNLKAEIIRAGAVRNLEAVISSSQSVFRAIPYTIVSLDYIKSDKRRHEFIHNCPGLVVVDEAHGCVRKGGGGRQQRYDLLRELSQDPKRHMIFLTATPHAGDNDGFMNLLGLLRPEFQQLRDLPKDKQRKRLREQLRDHFIQRRRHDIKEWHDEGVVPRRQQKDGIYNLTKEYGDFLDQVRQYTRQRLSAGGGQMRMRWWAALALLRCVASSPAAAAAALDGALNKPDAGLDEDAREQESRRTVFDHPPVEREESDDLPVIPLAHDVDRMARFIKTAKALSGPKKDPKLAQLFAELAYLIDDGYSPVVFCRYLKTAAYLAEHLKIRFPKHQVAAVTGGDPPAIRARIIEELPETNTILVATDCLAEGINLQHRFDAVIHYDLCWNPNRHEQRIGRVDRFGQPSRIIRSVMIYGSDNPVDGAVLQVILRKAEAIREALGVLVPMPHDDETVANVILQRVLGGEAGDGGQNQLSLDFIGEVDTSEEAIAAGWERAAGEVDQQTSLFAQRRIRLEDVLEELEKSRALLGDEADIQRFVTRAAARLQAELSPVPNRRGRDVFHFPQKFLPKEIRRRLANQQLNHIEKISFTFQPPPGVHYLHRAHPLVHLLAEALAEQALEDRVEGLPRAGAVYTAGVETRAFIYLLRLRMRLGQTVRRKNRTVIAEEALGLCLQGGELRVLDKQELTALMSLPTSSSMDARTRERQVEAALKRISQRGDELASIAAQRAALLQQDHTRVRAGFDKAGKCEVQAMKPDVIGTYVLVPAQA